MNQCFLSSEQLVICQKYGVKPVECPPYLKVGVAIREKADSNPYPLNGLRYPPQGDTTGWYIWSGVYSTDPNFFDPLHVKHLGEWYPEAVKYLALPPGWRFLIAPGHEDVWEDPNLLSV